MKRILAISCFFLSASCATLFQSHARVVKKQPGKGGTIAVEQGLDNGANAKTEANSMMAENCSGKYEVTEEGEVVIGKTGKQRAEEKDSLWGKKGTETTSTEMEQTEWRLTYVCK